MIRIFASIWGEKVFHSSYKLTFKNLYVSNCFQGKQILVHVSYDMKALFRVNWKVPVVDTCSGTFIFVQRRHNEIVINTTTNLSGLQLQFLRDGTLCGVLQQFEKGHQERNHSHDYYTSCYGRRLPKYIHYLDQPVSWSSDTSQ